MSANQATARAFAEPAYENEGQSEQKSHQSAVIRELLIKRQHKKIKSRLLLKCSLLFALGLLVMFRYASITEIGYQVNASQKTHETLQAENDRLEVNLARQVNLTEVSIIAMEKLGMQKPQPYQIVRISVQPMDQTELMHVELSSQSEELPWYQQVWQGLKAFLGLLS